MKAIESVIQVRRAARDWERKFNEGAELIGRRDGPVYWHEDLRVWASFVEEASRHWRPGAHLNYFGYRPFAFKASTIVQISPPTFGRNTNLQGAFGIDEDGHRWILHQGRLHPAQTRISQSMFATAAPTAPTAELKFRDGHSATYFRVANLDAPSRVLQRQLADFVHLCERVRMRYTGQAAAADELETVEALELKITPELTADFEYGSRAGGVGTRVHGAVHEALVAELQVYGAKAGNDRVGRYGPDLVTDGSPPKLFEIKSSQSASCLQQAVGQLFIYEKVLGRSHHKIAVLPAPVSAERIALLKQLEVSTLVFHQVGKKVHFDRADIDRIMTSKSPSSGSA